MDELFLVVHSVDTIRCQKLSHYTYNIKLLVKVVRAELIFLEFLNSSITKAIFPFIPSAYFFTQPIKKYYKLSLGLNIIVIVLATSTKLLHFCKKILVTGYKSINMIVIYNVNIYSSHSLKLTPTNHTVHQFKN